MGHDKTINVTPQELVNHHLFCLEYIFTEWGPKMEQASHMGLCACPLACLHTTLDLKHAASGTPTDVSLARLVSCRMHRLYSLYSLGACILRQNPDMRITTIFDMEGLSTSSLFGLLGTLRRVVRCLESHFVGRCEKNIVINSPTAELISRLIFPMLTKEVCALCPCVPCPVPAAWRLAPVYTLVTSVA